MHFSTKLMTAVLGLASVSAVAQLGDNPQPAQYPQSNTQQNGYPQGNYPQQNGYPNATQQNGYPNAAQSGYPSARRADSYQPSPIPAGTQVTVRTVERIESHDVTSGQTFRATIDQPVIVNEQLIVDRGAEAMLRVVSAKDAGKLKGNAELALALTQVRDTKGQMLNVYSDTSTTESKGKGKGSATKTGIGALAGAGLGAIIGGGKGAAIGAGAGAGTGAVVAASTRGPEVKVPSETLLTFTIQ